MLWVISCWVLEVPIIHFLGCCKRNTSRASNHTWKRWNVKVMTMKPSFRKRYLAYIAALSIAFVVEEESVFFLTSKMKHFFSLVRLDQLIIYGIFKCWRQLECYKWRKGKSHAINCPDSKTLIGVVLRVRGRVWFEFDIKVKTESPINLEEVQTSTLLINEYLIHIRSTLPECSSVLLRSPRMLFNGVS